MDVCERRRSSVNTLRIIWMPRMTLTVKRMLCSSALLHIEAVASNINSKTKARASKTSFRLWWVAAKVWGTKRWAWLFLEWEVLVTELPCGSLVVKLVVRLEIRLVLSPVLWQTVRKLADSGVDQAVRLSWPYCQYIKSCVVVLAITVCQSSVDAELDRIAQCFCICFRYNVSPCLIRQHI